MSPTARRSLLASPRPGTLRTLHGEGRGQGCGGGRRDGRGRSRDAAHARGAAVSGEAGRRARVAAVGGHEAPLRGRRDRGAARGARGLRGRRHRALQRRARPSRASSRPSRRRAARSSSTTRAPGAWTPTCPLVVPEVNMEAAREAAEGHHRQPELLARSRWSSRSSRSTTPRGSSTSSCRRTRPRAARATPPSRSSLAQARAVARTASAPTPKVFPGAHRVQRPLRLEGGRRTTTPRRS